MYNWEEEDQTAPPLSFQDNGVIVPPPLQVAEVRAAKHDYALGAASPGPEKLKTAILAGAEPEVRAEASALEDLRLLEAKQEIIAQIARAKGGALTKEEMDVVYNLTTQELRTNPKAILEQKFAEKYISDVFSAPGASWEQGFTPVANQEATVATNVIGQKEFFTTRLQDLEAEWEQQGLISKIGDYAGQMVPFLPWWRQKQALQNRPGVEFLQGSTMAENVMYLWTLPFEQRLVEYEKAITYLKSKNMLDAWDFAKSMVSFPTSEEYIANTITMADYSTAGSVVTKLGGKLLRRGAKEVVEATKPDVTPPTATGPVAKQEPVTQTPVPEQLDLFGPQPEQGSFRFMEQPQPPWQQTTPPERPSIQQTPTGLERDRKGRMQRSQPRSSEYRDDEGPYSIVRTGPLPETSPTGIFRDAQSGRFGFNTGAMRQIDLPLSGRDPGSSEQRTFDFGPPKPPTLPPTTTVSGVTKTGEQALQETRKLLGDAVKAVEGHAPTVEGTLAATGQIQEAGFLGALRRIQNPLGVGTEDFARELPTFANPGKFWDDLTNLGREFGQRAKADMLKQGEALVGALTGVLRGQRLTPEALALAKSQTAARLRKDYGPKTNDAILDIKYIPAEMNPASVDTMVAVVGKTNATGFDSFDQAKMFRDDIYELGEKEAPIVQQGHSWFIEIPRHIDETNPDVRDLMMVPENRTNVSIPNALLNWLRSADDILPKFQTEQRLAAQHPLQKVRKQLRDVITRDIDSLPKASKLALNDILRWNRDMPSVRYPGERGRWFDTLGELEQAWVERHGRPPTAAEARAYDTFRRVSDFDWIIRNLAVYRDKARQAVEQFRLRYADDAGQKSISGWFEAKAHDSMPWNVGHRGDQDAGVWLWDAEAQKGKFYYKFNMTKEERDFVDNLTTEKGYKVLQVFTPRDHPLKGIAKRADGKDLEDQVNYVITNSFERSPLSWHQVDYRPGGHVVYPHKWYVGQPQIVMGRDGKATLVGDNVALNFETHAQAKKFAERMDHARVLLKLGKEAELVDYLAKNLPHTVDEFKSLFFRHDSPFSLDHKVVIKEAGKSTIETVPELKQMYAQGNLIDSTKNVHDLSNFMDKAYLADRDLILNTVVENKGVMRLEKAEQLDPFLALNKAMGQGLRNLWLNDYKIQAVESWMKEFSGVMQPNEKTLAAHPTYFLFHPQWKPVSDVNFAELAAAKATQRAIVNFIGAKSELSSATNYLNIKLQDMAYRTLGQGKVTRWLADHELGSTNDPVSFMRGAAFHTKLGFFNPVQLFLQMQSINHAIAVTPRHAIPGVAAAVLMRFAAHNPAMLPTLSKVASKLGWKAGSFEDMYAAFQRTGLYEVGGEAVLRNDTMDPHLFRSTLGDIFIDKGSMFFNEGERMPRLTAFAAAWREFREKNPRVVIGDREITQIMRRQNDLAVNMTRVSAAAWQEGVWSVPTQFFAFNARLMEQFLGKRLTGLEKARALTMYSAMYGVPVGVGAAVGVWPIYDDIKEEALKRGVEINDGFLNILTNGLYDTAARWALGKDYNITERYGPGNNRQLKEILDGDKTFLEVVFGASGTILNDLGGSFAAPFYYKTAAVFNDGSDYPLKASDFMTLFRNISTVDLSAKAYGAAAYGAWYTKSGTKVGPADNMDAAMAVLGLTPQELADAYSGQRALKDEAKAQDAYERLAMENYRRGLQAGAAGDFNGMSEYWNRAAAAIRIGKFNYEQQSAIFQRAIRSNQDLKDKVNWDLFRKAPSNRTKERLEQFEKRNAK